MPVEDAGGASVPRVEVASEALPVPSEFGCRRPPGRVGVRPHGETSAFLDGPILSYGVARNVRRRRHLGPIGGALLRLARRARGLRGACARAGDPFLLGEERAALKRFLRALPNATFSSSSPGTTTRWRRRRCKTSARLRLRPHAPGSSPPGAAGRPAFRSSMPAFANCAPPDGCTRACGRSPPRSCASTWASIGGSAATSWTLPDRGHPALAVGNWQWVAGVADLAAYPRIYNPVKQARRLIPPRSTCGAGSRNRPACRTPRSSSGASGAAPPASARCSAARRTPPRSSTTKRRRARFSPATAPRSKAQHHHQEAERGRHCDPHERQSPARFFAVFEDEPDRRRAPPAHRRHCCDVLMRALAVLANAIEIHRAQLARATTFRNSVGSSCTALRRWCVTPASR